MELAFAMIFDWKMNNIITFYGTRVKLLKPVFIISDASMVIKKTWQLLIIVGLFPKDNNLGKLHSISLYVYADICENVLGGNTSTC